MLLYRHRFKTLLSTDADWTCWYTTQRVNHDSGVEVESKEFDEADLVKLGSSKELGTLYKEK